MTDKAVFLGAEWMTSMVLRTEGGKKWVIKSLATSTFENVSLKILSCGF